MICSDCLINEGLKIEAERIGIRNNNQCTNCNSFSGKKLNKEIIQKIVDRFFRQGSIDNDYHLPIYQLSFVEYEEMIPFTEETRADLKLLKANSGINIAYHSPRLTDLGYTDISAEIEIIEHEAKEKLNVLIDRLFSKFKDKTLNTNTKLFRIRVNPNSPRTNAEFDTPPKEYIREGRLNNKETPIFYCSEDLNTCVHEVKSTVYDNLYLATFKTKQPLKILSLIDYNKELDLHEMENYISYISYLFRTDLDYNMCQKLAIRAKERGYDGIEYYSFFSKVIGDRKSNIALFGYPMKDGILSLKSVNRLRIEKIDYKLNFGPVQ
ncbi:RES family NAD+ phosphorylase [Carboxylicivirga sp. RSCT41]|uniref:RES family NAD+ phosphorylase n=1 Tax=Carboxylicivirga agarovorans TaxID=3417570 RepID=UPI003D33B5CE